MKFSLVKQIESLLQGVALARAEIEPKPEAALSDMLTVIEQAKQEWKNTANYFDNVTEPELIDHAILVREAAERKYMYLLKQAKLADRQALLEEKNAIVQGVSAANSVQANETA